MTFLIVILASEVLLNGFHMTPKHILLRSSWQTINIGDIAHTPGMLALLEELLPETRITLWPNQLSAEVETLLKTRFPRLKLKGDRDTQELFAECDFMLHGSGPGLVGGREMQMWQATGKPYGIGGITLSDEELREYGAMLTGAKFVLCRDSLSIDAAKKSGLKPEFFPDATFFLDLKNDAFAERFLAQNDLEPKKFACFIPRLRWTPYWIAKPQAYLPSAIAEKESENAQFLKIDHAKMRAAIVAWVRQTGHKALLCPEMSYQVELLRPHLFDPLPDDVKPFVVLKESYWLTDAAAATYAQAAAVLSFECHSPIMAVVNGTPAIYLRQPTDTRKGQMWRDVGLCDWLMEIDEVTGDQVAARLLSLLDAATPRHLAAAQNFVAGCRQILLRVIKIT
jgi:polysaccharide pyruvyl transferase WcaK-like protein